MIGIPIHSCESVKSTVYFNAMSKRPDRAAIKREWIQRASLRLFANTYRPTAEFLVGQPYRKRKDVS